MKVIDLLVKISKGEEVPKEIKIENDELYFSKYKNTYVFEDGGNLNWCYYVTNKSLTDEIEIIEEEKEIEEIKMIGCNMEIDLFDKKTLLPTENMQTEFIISKINELVREVRKLKDLSKCQK